MKLGLYRFSLLNKALAFFVLSIAFVLVGLKFYEEKLEETVFKEKARTFTTFTHAILRKSLGGNVYTDFGFYTSLGKLKYQGNLVSSSGNLKEQKSGELYYKTGVNLLFDFVNTYNSVSPLSVHFVSEKPMDLNHSPVDVEKRFLSYFKVHRDVNDVVYREGGKFYYFKPLYATKACLRCHGKHGVRDEEVASFLKDKYGKAYEKASSYSEGDLIGMISVSMPEEAVRGVGIPTSTFLLIVFGYGILAFGFYYFVIRRLNGLREVSKQITKGKLDVKVGAEGLQGIKVFDEITQVEQEIVKLKNSIQIALRRRKK